MRHSVWRVTRFALLWALLVAGVGSTLAQAGEAPRTELVVVAEADSYLVSNLPDENFGGVGGLFIGYNIGAEQYGAARMVLRFPMPDEIPAHAVVTDARLDLYLTYANPSTDTPMETKLRQLLSAWDENTVTWNSEPLWDPDEVLVTAEVGDEAGVYQWGSDELAAVVDGWISGAIPNYGLDLQGDETMELGRERVFYSTEAPVGAERMPRLFIEYTLDETAPEHHRRAAASVLARDLHRCVERRGVGRRGDRLLRGALPRGWRRVGALAERRGGDVRRVHWRG